MLGACLTWASQKFEHKGLFWEARIQDPSARTVWRMNSVLELWDKWLILWELWNKGSIFVGTLRCITCLSELCNTGSACQTFVPKGAFFSGLGDKDSFLSGISDKGPVC
jgi:hypothetical protein